MTATIHDTSRCGTFEILDTNWDSNGTLRVTIRETVGDGCLDMSEEHMVKAMRRLARKAIHHPEKTRSSRVIGRGIYYGCDTVTFAVSRNN